MTLTMLFALTIYFIIIPIIKEEAFKSEARIGLNTLNNIKSIAMVYDTKFLKLVNDDNVAFDEQREIILDKLREHLTSEKDGTKIHAYIFNSDNKIVLHPNAFLDGSNIANIKLRDQEGDFATRLKEQAHKNKTLQYIWDKVDDPGNYIYQKISWIEYSKEADLYFITSAYLDDINANANMIAKRIQFIVLIILLVSLIFVYFTINSFLKPLSILTKAAKKVQSGDLATRSNIQGNDEVAQLASTFDMMVEQIETTIETLDAKVEEKTKEIKKEKFLLDSIMNAQSNIVLTSDGAEIQTANKAFLEFFNVSDVDAFKKEFGECICDSFENKSNTHYIQKKMGEQSWSDYILDNPNQINKTLIKKDGVEHIFSISVQEFTFEDSILKTSVFSDITKMETIQKELEDVYTNLTDSIKYASLIQTAILPQQTNLDSFFKDSFVIWEPKDIVGGDIYLFETLRHEDEALMMVVDCTGHGVPGAFVTMLVKALEKDIVANINKSDFEVSPAIILQYFNTAMKKLLHQENKDAQSNAGFDAGIIYINKKENIVRFAGANTPLFYTNKEDEVTFIKGDKVSIGDRRNKENYMFKDHEITLTKGMKFYATTDGYIDQKGGEKGLTFGKSKFKKLIKEYCHLEMDEQKNKFDNNLITYQNDYFRLDDITLIAMEVK